MRPLRLLLVPALLATVAVLGPSPSPAAAAATCSIEQITDTTGGGSSGNFANAGPSISGDGTVIAFESDRNYTGGNADANQEIFRYVRSSESFGQITSTTGGSFANRSPSVNGDGTDIAFTTNRNIGSDNPENNLEVFRWVGGGMITALLPVTSTTTGSSTGASINAAGTRIAFQSEANIGSNADGNSEIYLFATSGPTTTQITTTTTGDNYGSELNGPATFLVFGSDSPLAGNPDGSPEVFVRNLATGATSALTSTVSPGETFEPAINGNGRRIAFASTGTFAGRNTDGSDEVFLRETTAGTTTALTNGDGGAFGVGGIALSGAGTRVVFETDDDLLGTNADGGQEVWLRDFGTTGQRTTQVTSSATDSSGEIDVDNAGRLVVFSSRGDLTGDNGDGNREIFLATCSPPPAPALCDGQLVTVARNRGQQPTTAADVIRGTNGPDTVNGRGGNDRFCGLNGGDTFNGGPGNDRAFGQNGNDRLRGDGGNDRLDGANGSDALRGGGGRDTCIGGPQADTAGTCEARFGIP